MKITFCTTCTGRLHHLRATYPHNLSSLSLGVESNFVLLDYNSQDGLEDWAKQNLLSYIQNGWLTYYKTTEPLFYNSPHAKNIAHLLADGDIVVNLDADNYLVNGYPELLISTYSDDNYNKIVRYEHEDDFSGRIAIGRELFIKLGGYDERFGVGYGFDDLDLISRVEKAGYPSVKMPRSTRFNKTIKHDSLERGKHMNDTDVASTMERNCCLMTANMDNNISEVNEDKVWGKATVIKNFAEQLTVGV